MSNIDLKKQFEDHTHNGIDSKKLPPSSVFEKKDSIPSPDGGATIDSQARNVIDIIITRLEQLGLIDEN